MTDLTYTQNGMFTRFIAASDVGEDAWRQMAKALGGDVAILNSQLKSTLYQLRKAGYKVTKAKKVTKKEMNGIFAELEALGL